MTPASYMAGASSPPRGPFTAYGAQYWVSDRIGRRPTIGIGMLLQAAAFVGFAGVSAPVGCVFMLAGSTAPWGPVAAGVVHDATGSSRTAPLLTAVCNVGAAGVLATCRPVERRSDAAPGYTPPP